MYSKLFATQHKVYIIGLKSSSDRFTIWKTNSMAMKRLASPVTVTRALIAKAMEAAAIEVRDRTSAK